MGGLWQRVSVLERDKERREWLAEAAAAAERRRERSRSPGWNGVGFERYPDCHGRGLLMRERRREERCREW